MASRPQPFHLARHTRASRACGQFVGRFAPRAATLGRPLPQKDHFQSVFGGFPPAQAGQMHPTAERRLESELCALGGQPFDFIHEQSARRHASARPTAGFPYHGSFNTVAGRESLRTPPRVTT
jgi:hypothetical protein